MTRTNTTSILQRRDHYAADYSLVDRQENPKPGRAALLEDATTLQIRRVQHPDGTEELQIEINIDRFHDKRTISSHSSFIATPEIADAIGKACLEVRK